MAIPSGVNFASKFSPVLDQAFKLTSYTDSYTNKDYDFDGVNKITLYTLNTVTPVDYNMAAPSGVSRYGGWNEMTDEIKDYILSQDKAFQTSLDRMNEQDSFNAKSAAKWLALEMNQEIVPMYDQYCFQVAADATDTGIDLDGTAASTRSNPYDPDTVYADVMAMNSMLDEYSVPKRGRILFVDPLAMDDLKVHLTPYLSQTSDKIVRNSDLAGEIDGLPVMQVPAYLLGTGANGKIRVQMWHKNAMLGCRKLTETNIDNGRPFVSGDIISGRLRFDNFALRGWNNSRGVAVKMATFNNLHA